MEIIGETKVCVSVRENACSEEESWELDVDDEELAEINPDFLEHGESSSEESSHYEMTGRKQAKGNRD